MHTVGRFLQALGLVLLPVALFWGFSRGDAPGAQSLELGIMAAGVVLFLIGRGIEKKGA